MVVLIRIVLTRIVQFNVPMDVDFMISDCFEALRPSLKRFQTFEQAQEEVTKLEQVTAPSNNNKIAIITTIIRSNDKN